MAVKAQAPSAVEVKVRTRLAKLAGARAKVAVRATVAGAEEEDCCCPRVEETVLYHVTGASVVELRAWATAAAAATRVAAGWEPWVGQEKVVAERVRVAWATAVAVRRAMGQQARATVGLAERAMDWATAMPAVEEWSRAAKTLAEEKARVAPGLAEAGERA